MRLLLFSIADMAAFTCLSVNHGEAIGATSDRLVASAHLMRHIDSAPLRDHDLPWPLSLAAPMWALAPSIVPSSCFGGRIPDGLSADVRWHFDHKHVLSDVASHEPTCTEFGCESLICSAGEEYNYLSITAALGHVEKQVGAVEATCGQSGHTAGMCCARCNQLISGKEIPATGATHLTSSAAIAQAARAGITRLSVSLARRTYLSIAPASLFLKVAPPTKARRCFG